MLDRPFAKPTSADIFSCDSGPFTNAGSRSFLAVMARLAAAFNRSTLLTRTDQPNSTRPQDYCRDETTNHWSRIDHANSPQGYGFPSTTSAPRASDRSTAAPTTPTPLAGTSVRGETVGSRQMLTVRLHFSHCGADSLRERDWPTPSGTRGSVGKRGS
ncbi:beta-1,3-glucanase family protein [Streptomyces sp. NPDC096153]|uniref:beta-1,3-glucanase family protein n=1 Tax=Streptomyces sp. NPDC096153 TaxID=3155548 RepID=UPI00332C9188